MRTIPSADELLEIAAQFLRAEAAAAARSDGGFHSRVAANAIDIVRREMAQGDAADEAAVMRLRRLLRARSTDLPRLEARLALAIRSGRLTATSPGLMEHLWESTLAEVAIDQPGYATYRRLTRGTSG
jgi:hypothetical protein